MAKLLAQILYEQQILRFPQIIKLSTEEMCVHIESAAVNFLDSLMQDKLIYIDKADKGTSIAFASMSSRLVWDRNYNNFFATFLNKIQATRKGAIVLSCSPVS